MPNRRRVNPYFVVFRGCAFYLVGYCHKRDGLRLFRLDRISRLKVTDRQFTRDPSVTLDSLFAYSWEVYLGPPITVRVFMKGLAKKVVESGIHHPTEKLTRPGANAIIYEARVSSVEEFGRWLLGFGKEAKVLAPPELKNWVQNVACGIVSTNSAKARKPRAILRN